MASVAKREWTYKGETKSAWVVRYKHDGKHASKQFDKKKDADSYKRKVEREIEDGVHVTHSDTALVSEVVEAFLRAEEIRFADGRIGRGHHENVGKIMRWAVLPYIGHRVISSITPSDVEDWYNRMVRERGIAPATAKFRVQFCNKLFEFARRKGFTKTNPLQDGTKLLQGVRAKPIRTFTVEEISAILAACEIRRAKGRHLTHNITKAFVHIATFCGLRFGEISGLTLPRINFDAGVIEVRHSLTSWDELKEPKSKAGFRDVPMPPHIVTILRQWIASDYRPNDRQLLFRIEDDRVRSRGGHIDASSFHRTFWRPMLERAGLDLSIEQPHFHALRHFAASWMIANNVSLMDTAELLGHREFDTTLQIYAHSVMPKRARHSAFDAMAGRLLAPPTIELCANEVA